MSSKRAMKSYEELDFRDDFMFGKVMEDKELCREVLECLLQRPIGELKELQTQREFHYTADGKPIRLDVYNEDTDRNIYDTEMENLNHKSVESHYLPERSRFYQGSIDIDYMNKGNSYKSLPESSVMFICTFDPFGGGLSKYSFRERCDEDMDLLLNDGTAKIFYNCCYRGEDIPESLREFYEYIETGKAGNELTKKIDEAVVRGRSNELWRTQYMKEWVIIQDAKDEGVEEGIKQGREEGLYNAVQNLMKNMGVTFEKALDILEVQGKERDSIIKMMRG
ncbi:MAG: Rpn family recombination-promoting nuclease/putative transposase [Lachnospiraceae bacterium]|nr:Rpn family recombination-promoting nuclease/putative transposase [Lachnospiraceae bacterium]